jgi:hypothetical protein
MCRLRASCLLASKVLAGLAVQLRKQCMRVHRGCGRMLMMNKAPREAPLFAWGLLADTRLTV